MTHTQTRFGATRSRWGACDAVFSHTLDTIPARQPLKWLGLPAHSWTMEKELLNVWDRRNDYTFKKYCRTEFGRYQKVPAFHRMKARQPVVVGLERDEDVLVQARANMPRGRGNSRVRRVHGERVPTYLQGGGMFPETWLLGMSVSEFLIASLAGVKWARKLSGFNAVWLDFCAQFCTEVKQSLLTLPHALDPKRPAAVSVTTLAARESREFNVSDDDERVRRIVTCLLDAGTHGVELVGVHRYIGVGSSPMLLVVTKMTPKGR